MDNPDKSSAVAARPQLPLRTPPGAAQDSQMNPHPASPQPARTPNEWRKPVGVIISVLVILGAVALTLWAWNITEHHPRTDDAIARANVVAIAPRVRGQIVKLNVQDNQAVA